MGLATAALGVVSTVTPLGAEFEQNVGLKWLFLLRGPIAPPAEVLVAAIDDQTGAQLGLSNLPREWPRTIHASLVDHLSRHGAAAIVFDFDFQLAKQDQDDVAFATSVAHSERVVLAEKLLGKRQPLLDLAGRPTGSVWVEKLAAPIPALAAAARGLGSFPLPKVEVAVHEFWVFKPSVGDAPTMPAVALQVAGFTAYDKLSALYRANQHASAGALPLPPPADARAEDLRKFMIATRRAFRAQPALAAHLRDVLDAAPADTFTSREHQLLCGLLGMYAGPDHRLLNFYGPPGSIATVPYQALVGPRPGQTQAALPELDGKSVFVGFSDLFDPGQPDRFYTVYTNDDGVDLSGVEIAATAYANLFSDTSVHSLHTPGALVMPAMFGFVLGFLLYFLPAIVALPLTLALSAAYGYHVLSVFRNGALWLPLAVPLLVQLPLALLVGLTAQYLSERTKKKRATRAISLYLPAHLAHDFTEKNLDSSALDRVTHSVCFASDMAGFTSIAEKLRPKELAVFLNDYFESLAAPLRKHGVDVIEFRADGIMCAWTAEQPERGIRERALAAALDAQRAMAAFKERHDLLSQSLRIGLESGTVYVGHAGGGGHFVYSIVGDCANTAARIEGLNKHLGTQLLASRDVIVDIGDLVTRFIGEFRFVGKAETVPIVEVLGRSPDCAPALVDLATRFGAAMEQLHNGLWQAAELSFAAILDAYPQDGPARFQIERCQRFAQNPPGTSPWVVNMDAK